MKNIFKLLLDPMNDDSSSLSTVKAIASNCKTSSLKLALIFLACSFLQLAPGCILITLILLKTSRHTCNT